MADMTMGQRIAEERKKLGISQEALGEKMGVSRQAISKWESDGAVPEIDKLIALSKLFGVSVGWLLGVEEDTRKPDELSEEQLKMVEEIVRKYQPQPEPKKKHVWRVPCIILVIVAAVIAGQFAHNAWQTHIADFNGLHSTLTYVVMAKLGTLESQMVSIGQSTPLSLLADYKLEIVGIVSGSQPAAEISFSAVPNTWQEGDSASLSVRREGVAMVSQPCTWDGAFLTTQIVLEEANGYELCFTLTHSDGTQEQQVLSDYDIQNLKSTLSITAQATSGKWSYENNILGLYNYEFQVTMPLSGEFNGSLTWESVDLILTTGSGEELGRFSLLTAQNEDDAEILSSPEIWLERAEIRFVDLNLPKNEGILLWLSAKTDNGLSAMEPVAAWATDETGKLHTQ